MIILFLMIELFIILIAYTFVKRTMNSFGQFYNFRFIEGLEENTQDNTDKSTYQPYNIDSNNVLILTQQNSGNIEYLKNRLNELEKKYKKIDDIENNVSSLQTQLETLSEAQQQYATDISGGNIVETSGTNIEEEPEQ